MHSLLLSGSLCEYAQRDTIDYLLIRILNFSFTKQALLAAWAAACKVPGATVEIPTEFKFLIEPITLQGPCMPDLVLQVDFLHFLVD